MTARDAVIAKPLAVTDRPYSKAKSQTADRQYRTPNAFLKVALSGTVARNSEMTQRKVISEWIFGM
jgi:hypothetical protein